MQRKAIYVLIFRDVASRQAGDAPLYRVECASLLDVVITVDKKVAGGAAVDYQDLAGNPISQQDYYTYFTGLPYPGRVNFVNQITTIRAIADSLRWGL